MHESTSLDILIPLVAIIFSCSIPMVAIIFEHFTKKAKMRVIEKAIEKGMSLEGLSLEGKKAPRMPYRGGMVALAVGLGLVVISGVFSGNVQNSIFGAFSGSIQSPLLGAGAIVGLVGVALIINDRINFKRHFNKDADQL